MGYVCPYGLWKQFNYTTKELFYETVSVATRGSIENQVKKMLHFFMTKVPII